MNRLAKIKITELNPHVICVLCGGYYINATTIVECLHSFCRTCITRYLETSKYCPVCDVMVHKTRPLEYIRSDKTLQDLVYKLVPGLYKSEMKRRREYYAQHDRGVLKPPSEDRGTEFHDRIIYTEDEKMSLSLELCAEGIPFKTPSSVHGHNGPENIKISDVRYLSCPAAFSVGNLKKFIRMKFDLKLKYEIDLFHTAEPLPDYYTLMDIAYIYTWTRRCPLRLYYTVYECKIPRKIPDPICREATVNTERIVAVDNKDLPNGYKSASTNEKTKKDSKKRKLPEGPDDIIPDFKVERTSQSGDRRRNNPGQKKRQKKSAAILAIDDSVMEAMSESEEQLAKLTLDCSNDLGAISVDTGDETSSQSDSNETSETVDKQSGVRDDPTVKGNSQCVVNGVLNDMEIDNGTGSEPIPDDHEKSKPQISPNSISVCLFQPLNGVDSENSNRKEKRDTIFDFINENNEKDNVIKGTSPRPKARPGPGRKKQTGKDGDKVDCAKVTENGGINGVKTSENGDIVPQKKKPGRKKKSESATAGGATSNDIKPKTKPAKVIQINSETGERVKRKYVRKVPKIGPPESTAKKVPKKNKKANQEDGKDEENKSTSRPCDAGESKEIDNRVEESVDQDRGHDVTAMPACDVDKLDKVSGKVITDNTNSKQLTLPDKCDHSVLLDQSELCHVPSPSTPLYGQTPKLTESNQGLPVSPNPECAQSGVLDVNNSLNTNIGPNDKTIEVVNGTPVAHNEKSVLNGVIKDATTRDLGNSVPVADEELDDALVIDEGALMENGYHGNVNGMVETDNELYTRNGDIPQLRPAVSPDVRILSDYQIHPHSPSPGRGQPSPMGNVYAHIVDPASDQPLDLTSNGRRDEYMKGKIFKTKMLKRTFPKPDFGIVTSSPKEKLAGSPSSNGIHPHSWT